MNPLIDDLDFSEADPPLPWGMESRAGARGKLGLAALQNQLNQRTAMARVSGQAQDRRATMDGGVRQASSGPGLMDVLRLGPQFLQSTASGLASSAISGLSLPGDAWTGKVLVPGVNVPADAPEAPEQRNSLVRRALDLTGTIGSATLAAPRGALGVGAVRPVKPKPFEATMYHGTTGDIPGPVTQLDGPAFLAFDEETGAHYANGHGVSAFKVKLDNPLHIRTPEDMGRVWNQSGAATTSYDGILNRGHSAPEQKLIDWAQDQGHDGIVIHPGDHDDYGWTETLNGPQAVVFDPKKSLAHKGVVQDAVPDRPVSPSKARKNPDFDVYFTPKGYEVVKDPNSPEGKTVGTYKSREEAEAAIPDPASSKSVLFAGGKGSAAPGLLAMSQDPFYSTLERVVSRGPASASPQQWLSTIKNAGVKQEELEWSGLGDKLAGQGGPMSKDELLQAVKDGTPKIQEVTKKGKPNRSDDAREFLQSLHDDGEYDFDTTMNDTQVTRAARRRGWDPDYMAPEELGHSASGPKFPQYQLPGGDNYREMLLTLPKRLSVPDTASWSVEPATWAKKSWTIKTPDRPSGFGVIANSREEAVQAGLDMYRVHFRPSDNYTSSHWDEPNVLAHVRMNDRTIPDASGTPQKTLFLEELQSDWHQQGRKEGYLNKGRLNQLDQKLKTEGRLSPEEGAEYNRLTDMESLSNTKGAVPDAPFKKTWPDLVLKRMVREAAEKGYDQIAWTDGATQADRYDLSKHVDKVSYYPGSKRLVAAKGRNVVMDKDGVSPEQLADHIGKDVADKLINHPTQKIQLPGTENYVHQLEGTDLKVGGEGMKGFYDNMLPKIAEKHFGKYGAKVGRSNIRTASLENSGQTMSAMDDAWDFLSKKGFQENELGKLDEADKLISTAERHGWVSERTNGHTVHVLPITPELRRAALSEGFPLFSSGVPSADSSGQPQYKLSPMPDGFNPFTARANRAMMPPKAEPSAGDQSMKNYKLSPISFDPFAKGRA